MATETLQHPGEFILTGPNLIGSSGEQININGLVLELNIYQNVDNPFMSGNILMNDAKGLYEYLPIIGQERLIFKLTTPSAYSSVNFEEYHAVIYNVEKRFNTNDRSQAYLLNWTTLDNYRNFRTKVSKSYDGEISSIVVRLLTDDLKSSKPMHVDATKNPRKYVIPNISPYGACQWLREEAISADQNPHYLFYENPNGYHFRSLDSLIGDQGSLSVPHKKTYISQPPKDPKEVGAALGTILAFQVEDSSNTFTNGRAGMFASTLLYHDVFNKTLQKFEYNYIENCYKNRNQLNQDSGKYGPFISESKIDGEKKITDFPQSKIFVHPTAGKELYSEGPSSDATLPYTNNNAQSWLQESRSREMEREYFTIKIETYGDTNIMVGDIVDVIIPSNREGLGSSGGKEAMDAILSGRYLVTQLHHQVTPPSQAHKMTFTAMKDSVSSALPETEMKYNAEKQGVKNIGLVEDKQNLTQKPRSILPAKPSISSWNPSS